MPLDPTNLKQIDLVRLPHSTPLGPVINTRQMYRRRENVGVRIGRRCGHVCPCSRVRSWALSSFHSVLFPERPEMTDSAEAILAQLREACAANRTDRFCVRSEWTGYLPFAISAWIEVAGRDLQINFSQSDLNHLKSTGTIEVVEHSTDESDISESTTYRFVKTPEEPT